MNTNLLLQEFDRIADAPDVIARLRAFVLDLAVRGKLTSTVHQAPGRTGSDEESKYPFAIPADWTWTRLDDLEPRYQNGTSSRGAPAGEPTIVLRLADIKGGRISLDSPRRVTLPRDAAAKYRVASGDILIIRVNGSSDLVGRFIVSDVSEKFAYCDHFIRMQLPGNRVSPSFLGRLGDSGLLRKQITSLFVTSAGQKTVNQRHIGALLFPLPPLAEQLSIVEKIDELMALCDQMQSAQDEGASLRDALRGSVLEQLTSSEAGAATSPADVQFLLHQSRRFIAKPEHVGAVRKAIFNLALTGRLVETLDSDGDADDLIAAASAARRGSECRAAKRSTRSSPATVAGHALPAIPGSWRWVRLDEIADIVGGVTKDDKNQGLPGLIEVPYLRVANVQRGYLDLAKVTTIKVPAETASHLQLVSGDILFNEGGDRDKLGRGWIWEEQIDCCIHQNHVFRARLYAPIVDPRIVSWHGNTFGQRWFIEGGKQTTNLASVNKTTLRAFPVPIPPIGQQVRIVAKVSELMAVCDELEAALASAQMRRGRLLEALLRDALAAR